MGRWVVPLSFITIFMYFAPCIVRFQTHFIYSKAHHPFQLNVSMETGKNVWAQIFSDGVADSDSQQEKSKKSSDLISVCHHPMEKKNNECFMSDYSEWVMLLIRIMGPTSVTHTSIKKSDHFHKQKFPH